MYDENEDPHEPNECEPQPREFVVVGDVVRLKSGGPDMTVVFVPVEQPQTISGLECICTWFVKSRMEVVSNKYVEPRSFWNDEPVKAPFPVKSLKLIKSGNIS